MGGSSVTRVFSMSGEAVSDAQAEVWVGQWLAGKIGSQGGLRLKIWTFGGTRCLGKLLVLLGTQEKRRTEASCCQLAAYRLTLIHCKYLTALCHLEDNL